MSNRLTTLHRILALLRTTYNNNIIKLDNNLDELYELILTPHFLKVFPSNFLILLDYRGGMCGELPSDRYSSQFPLLRSSRLVHQLFLSECHNGAWTSEQSKHHQFDDR